MTLTEITINKAEYDALKEAELMLQCLESCGVNNWEGYEYALDTFEEERNERRN